MNSGAGGGGWCKNCGGLVVEVVVVGSPVVLGPVVNLESTALPLNPPGNTCPLRAFTSISAAWRERRSTKTVHSSVPTLTLLGLQILVSPMSACTSPWFLKSSTNWTFVAVKDTLRIKICTIALYCFIVLCCILLYCIVISCIVLYSIVLYCIVLYCTVVSLNVCWNNFLSIPKGVFFLSLGLGAVLSWDIPMYQRRACFVSWWLSSFMKLIVCRLLLWVVGFYPFFGLVAVSALFEIHVRTVLGSCR